jgi:ParB/RepB/Spo0J family partition protein
MTSGNFESFPIDKIWVNRETRQRKELKGIPELALSIRQNGLIHPPVIKRDGELVVGERRWTAMKSLGWTHASVQFVDELSEIELHAIEYEENISRVDLPWQEQCLAVARYHELRKQQDPEWNASRTAEALGMSATEVSARRSVAKELDAGNVRVAAAPQYSTARGIVERDTARKKSSAVAKAVAVSVPETAEAPVRKVPLLNEDFHEWAAAYTGQPFNFIHCDFPYGVGMDKSDQGGGAAHGTYADSPDVYWHLLRSLDMAMSNVVADSAHLMFWFSMDYYEETRKQLAAMGWRVNPFPLVWIKNDNTGILPDAKRGPRRIYETAFFASRGDRFIVNSVANAFAAPGREKEIHMNEKPVVMLKHFLRMFVDEYSTVLDPTAGSANALKAATALGAPTVLGLERDTEFFQRATEAYFNDAIEL